MRVDVICLTGTINGGYYLMCERTIKTLWESDPNIEFSLVLVESSNAEWKDRYLSIKGGNSNNKIKYLTPSEEFSYNKFLNIALRETQGSDWLIIINNDLIFHDGWLSKILDVHSEIPEIRSFSPYEPEYHQKYFSEMMNGEIMEGYNVGSRICGWCIVMRKSVMDSIGLWDERFSHWYQDDDYAMTLMQKGIRHALIKSSTVTHLRERSADLIPDEKKDLFTRGMKSVFDEKWGSVNVRVERPKIKIAHLLLDPDHPEDIPTEMWESRIRKQNESISCWRRISSSFYTYSEIYSKINRKDLPSESCAQPEIIQRSFDLINNPPVLSYGHYGAYLSHRRAILNEFPEDIDALLIIEGDVQFSISPGEMVDSIYDSVDFSKRNNGSLLTFGNVDYGLSSDASISDTRIPMGDYFKIDHFLCAHCYLIMASERKSIQNKLLNTGWHAWDIWLYWNYDKRVPIFSTSKPLVFEPDGISMIDYKNKGI